VVPTEHPGFQWFNWTSPPARIEPKTIDLLVEYVYTGGIKKLALPGAAISHQLVIDLLTIAANYDMPDLKIYAEYYLKDIIRVDNAW